jgi:hypothetical protein
MFADSVKGLLQTDKKINVDGQVRLGKLQNLKIILPSDQRAKVILATDPHIYDIPAPLKLPRQIPKDHIKYERYEYKLECTDDGVFLTGEGLTQSYGIFGRPGCGKTYLLKFLLTQIVAHQKEAADYKFGGLIIDPKAALLGDVISVMRDAGRFDEAAEDASDLVILNDHYMLENVNRWVNVLECAMKAPDLGKALSIAAQAAGIRSVEPYWPNEIGKILGATIRVLEFAYRKRPTLSEIVTALLSSTERNDGSINSRGTHTPLIRTLLDIDVRPAMAGASDDEKQDLADAMDTLDNYLSLHDKATIDTFIDQAYGVFKESYMKCFSPRGHRAKGSTNLYDDIIERGKFVLLSLSSERLAASRSLSALVKIIFQQTVLTRLQRNIAGTLTNFKRPVLFMADEFSVVATEIPGEALSDSVFFSQSRQFGCLNLIATQSIASFENSAVQEAWESIYSNYAAKIFMAAADSKTAEEASKLAGEFEFLFKTFDVTVSQDNVSTAENYELRDKRLLPGAILTSTFEVGDAAVIGTLDGKSGGKVRFIHVGDCLQRKEDGHVGTAS